MLIPPSSSINCAQSSVTGSIFSIRRTRPAIVRVISLMMIYIAQACIDYSQSLKEASVPVQEYKTILKSDYVIFD